MESRHAERERKRERERRWEEREGEQGVEECCAIYSLTRSKGEPGLSMLRSVRLSVCLFVCLSSVANSMQMVVKMTSYRRATFSG